MTQTPPVPTLSNPERVGNTSPNRRMGEEEKREREKERRGIERGNTQGSWRMSRKRSEGEREGGKGRGKRKESFPEERRSQHRGKISPGPGRLFCRTLLG